MSNILCLYHNVNVALGILNIQYESATNSYNLYHWPTIIYCAVINLFTLSLHQFATYTFWNVSMYCEQLGPIIVISMFVLFSNYALFMAVVLQSWLKRQSIYRVLKKFRNLLKYYLTLKNMNEHHKLVMNTRNLLLGKCFSAFCEIIVLYLHLFRRIRRPQCDYINHMQYKASSIYFGLIDILAILLDINIYMGFVFIYMCVQMLMQRLRQIERDIKLMHRLQRSSKLKEAKLNIHKKWREKLRQDIVKIGRDERKLKNLLEELFAIYQLQLLLLLLCFFLSLVALLFYFLIFILNIESVEIVQLLVLLFTLMTNIVNIILVYNVCELLINSFRDMGLLVYEIGIYASLGTTARFRQDNLVTSLELLLLQIQYRQFTLRVCGLFEIRNNTCRRMLSSIFINLLYLIQSVVNVL